MESANLGRNFRIKERMNLQVRAEFVNVFNRTYMPSPSTANPQNPVAKNSLGILTSWIRRGQRLSSAELGDHLHGQYRSAQWDHHRPLPVLRCSSGLAATTRS